MDVHGDLYDEYVARAAADRAARVRVGCYKLSSYRNTTQHVTDRMIVAARRLAGHAHVTIA